MGEEGDSKQLLQLIPPAHFCTFMLTIQKTRTPHHAKTKKKIQSNEPLIGVLCERSLGAIHSLIFVPRRASRIISGGVKVCRCVYVSICLSQV